MRWSGKMFLLLLALAAPAASVALRSEEAIASVAYDSPYSFEQTYGTALRLVRVDLGCKVTEKDPESGYMLFDYTGPESGKQVHHGAIEVVRRKQGTHVAVRMPTLPNYYEQMVLDALVKKLSAEHGEPPPRSKAPAPPPEDAGADSSDA